MLLVKDRRLIPLFTAYSSCRSLAFSRKPSVEHKCPTPSWCQRRLLTLHAPSLLSSNSFQVSFLPPFAHSAPMLKLTAATGNCISLHRIVETNTAHLASTSSDFMMAGHRSPAVTTLLQAAFAIQLKYSLTDHRDVPTWA